MLTPAPLSALETLRQVNRDLGSALMRLRPERKHCSTIRPQDFSGILSQLLLAKESLRRPPEDPEASAAFAREAREYRRNLEKLKRFLPDLQLRLLAEKSRIETARAHVSAAATWASQTLPK
jgi:hypothetical protein